MTFSTSAEFAFVLNRRLERLMPILTPSGIMMGFLLSSVFIHLRPLVPWLFALMTFSGALKLRVRELVVAVRKPAPILYFMLAAHVIIPLVVFSICSLIFDADTLSGYALLFAVPTAVSGFIWVSIYHGDRALALAIVLLDTLLAPLVVPGAVSLLLGTQVTLDMSGMATSLALMVLVPTVLGVGLNEASNGKVTPIVSPYLNVAAKLCLVLVIAANASPVASQIQLDNPQVYLIAALCIAFGAFAYICAKLIGIFARLSREKRVTLFFAIGLRNISAATTIAIQFFPVAASLPCLLGIVFQQVLAALMGKALMGQDESADGDT
ncbi:MAG: bile acid:sodium symporter family protein [Treponema sp.]|jgi:predicted Na+-dependent transporter|nr:bile acid:sodium symporter family protein [Treponema sp.]